MSFFGVQDHPQIDTGNPAAQAYLIDSARHWLERGVDGFRLDYANGPSHGFWNTFRAATRAANGESATLGEVVETAALQKATQAAWMAASISYCVLWHRDWAVAAARCALRRWRASRTTLRADDASGLYIYRCGDRAGAIVVLNNGATEARVRLPTASGALTLATDSAATLDGARLVIPPFGGALVQE